MSENKLHWINRIVPVLAFAAGIIIASVGGIMTISSSLKLALFDGEPYSYMGEGECRYDYNKPIAPATIETSSQTGYYERTPEEIQECIEQRTEQEKTQFENRHKQNMVDGVSALIIGGILLLVFRKRK